MKHQTEAHIANDTSPECLRQGGEHTERVEDQAEPEARYYQHVRQQMMFAVDQAHRCGPVAPLVSAWGSKLVPVAGTALRQGAGCPVARL